MNKHPLTIWRQRRKVGMAKLAADVGVSRQTIFRIERREIYPSLRTVGSIVTASDGELSADDFLPTVGEPAA